MLIHPQEILQDTTIYEGHNAISAGPITIPDSVTVTVNLGATWTII